MANPKHLAKLKEGMESWNEWMGREKLGRRADLSCADLHSADLRGGNFRRVNLSGTDLRMANLSHANLSRAILREAKLSGADIHDADLHGAQMIEADLEADLAGANLSGADLRMACLRSANLLAADLSRANLAGANLKDSNLQRAQFRLANLRRAQLQGARLDNANFQGAELEGANLQGVRFGEANITFDQIRSTEGFGFLTSADTILREIEFPPELKDSGVSLLSYFSTYLEDKYPDDQVTVRIQQRGRKVRMEIDPPEGKRHVIEKELWEYGLVVIGQKAPAQVLNDSFHIMKLEAKLELAQTELRMTQRLLAQQETTTQQFSEIARAAVSEKLDLSEAIRTGLLEPKIQITNNPVNNVHVTAEASSSASVETVIEAIEQQTPKLLAELRKEIDDPIAQDKAADHVSVLAKQATLPPLQRKPREELKSDWNALETIARSAGIIGSAASVWQTWGPAISKVLGF